MGNPLAGVNGDVWVTATPSIATTNETCTDSGDHTTYTASVHVFWDFDAGVTVQCSPNGSSSWVTVTDYVIWWAAGKIVFNTPRTVGTNNFVRIATGSYFAVTQLDATHTWDLALKAGTKDSTCFQATSGWMTNTTILKSASGKIDTYRNDDRLTKELGNLLGVQLYIDKANNIRWQFYAINAGADPKSDVNNLQMQGLSFTSVRDVYLFTS